MSSQLDDTDDAANAFKVQWSNFVQKLAKTIFKKEIYMNSLSPLNFFLEEFCVIFGAFFNQNLTICVQQGEKQQH